MVPDRIEQQILIDAPVEVVWEIVTDSAHVGGWFSDVAEIDLRPGGEARLTWKEHGVAHGQVEQVEPPKLFSFRWARPLGEVPRGGNSTLVEFTLTAEGDGTRLRVVESGFPELEGPEEEKAKYAEGNRQGWDAELDDLREYVSKHVRASATG